MASQSYGRDCEQLLDCVRAQPRRGQANTPCRPLPSTVPHLQASKLFSSVASVNNLMACIPLSVRIAVPFNSSAKSLLTNCLSVTESADVPAINLFQRADVCGFGVIVEFHHGVPIIARPGIKRSEIEKRPLPSRQAQPQARRPRPVLLHSKLHLKNVPSSSANVRRAILFKLVNQRLCAVCNLGRSAGSYRRRPGMTPSLPNMQGNSLMPVELGAAQISQVTQGPARQHRRCRQRVRSILDVTGG